MKAAFVVRARCAAVLVWTTTTSLQVSAQGREFTKAGVRPDNFHLAGQAVLNKGNEVACLIHADGNVCDQGTWPRNTKDQYMFAAGLAVLGIVPQGADCTSIDKTTHKSPTCFAWSGDTTGAFFYSNTGTRSAKPLTEIYDSHSAADLAAWPAPGSITNFPDASAFITDTSIYDASLIGRKYISDHDTWTLQWDGDSIQARTARPAPLGVTLEQRTHAFATPQGNESILYVVYKLTNVTNNKAFQRAAQNAAFGGLDSLPDAGWRIDSMYVQFISDPDIGEDGGNNQMTTVLPFNTQMSYHTAFTIAGNEYPTRFFHSPFFENAAGFVGVQIVKPPVDPVTGHEVDVDAFSMNTGGGTFPDAGTAQRAWRQASLHLLRSDGTCSFQAVGRICYAGQPKTDARGYTAAGPFSLNPGQSVSFVVAIMMAPVLNTPLISVRTTADNLPGIPTEAPGCNGEPIRPIEIAAGYIAPRQCPPPGGRVDARNVDVVQGSLLGNALVAKVVTAQKFVLSGAPDPPSFKLVPGDQRVTIVWDSSKAELAGDPFAALALSKTSGVYDPNFRKFDVEGYRIYRGTTPENLKLFAQVDKQGTTFVDARCAMDATHLDGAPCSTTTNVPLNNESSPLIQYRSITLLGGSSVPVDADTALATDIAAGHAKPLHDTGVTFSLTDSTVLNGFTYFYKVTAFDINSIFSAPSSLESAGTVSSIIPRAGSASEADADITKVHAVPDPYYAHSLLDAGPESRTIQFVNIPPRAIVRIYTVSGVLVKTIKHDDPTGGGRETWDLRAPNLKLVASGVYYIHVATPDGRVFVNKFTVINGPN